ncbi:MAG: alanine dehydrogenase [Candidatus Tectomicrobia bacterium]|uniref:Alanine dehydrogenase n=1 Tax=Tectimicrobiota bacterium TaxID=2528274 RepID=A0A932G166_UNCTE|nr:alanine dehydrogenase [Candidatus Tectomicrobia bacterium]
MIIGVPKEVKPHEYRVALVPAGVSSLVQAGHRVLVEKGCGLGSSLSDQEYAGAGAELVSRQTVFSCAELIVKVKEPLLQEAPLLSPGQILFTYLHLAAYPELTEALLKKGVIGIAYETVQTEEGALPLLQPMSEIAGRLSVQIGARLLEKTHQGSGILLGGVAGVEPARVVILGGGTAGAHAARVALAMGADATVLDVKRERLCYLEETTRGRLKTLISNPYVLGKLAPQTDLLIGAVLVPGARAPQLITEEMILQMKEGSVFVDISIDQGGCAETSRPTTYEEPTYRVGGVIHHCVTNMPSAVPRTSTFALTNATLPYLLAIANKGYRRALADDPALLKGLNLARGKLCLAPLAAEMEWEYCPPRMALS